MDSINFISRWFPVQLSALGPTELFYLFVVAAIVLSSFALLRRPFANLAIAVFYLVTANVHILGTTISAAIATLLIGNCFLGAVLIPGLKLPLDHAYLRMPLLLWAVAGLGTIHGYAHGNPATWILGDFYQVTEFAVLFVLAAMVVRTECQFRTIAHVIVGSIIATSALQIADVLTGASYLWKFHMARQHGDDLLRTINMNAPIAFVILLAALPLARTKWWHLAGLALVEVNLIMSFTRGLWLAAFVSTAFLLIVLPQSRVAVIKYGAVAGVFAVAFLYASGLGTVAIERLGYGVQQLRGVPARQETQISGEPLRDTQAEGSPPRQETRIPGPDSQAAGVPPEHEISVLASRRRLEYTLILPQIAEHPIMGKGLGSTYEIPGDAILLGPKGKLVENHFVHDLYLGLAFRLGIPALLIFLVMLWDYFWRTIRNLNTLNLSYDNVALMAGLVSAVVGEVVLSLTSSTFLNHPTAGVIGCIMAITVTALPRASEQPARIIAEPALSKGSP